jgi:hypothetical protein
LDLLVHGVEPLLEGLAGAGVRGRRLLGRGLLCGVHGIMGFGSLLG